MNQTIFSGSKINLPSIDAGVYSDDGYKVLKIVSVLKTAGFESELLKLKNKMVQIVAAGVQSAGTGIIQDPAGSAVGDPNPPVKTMAGGGSLAIYKKFPDLNPIPDMPSGGAAMNTSTAAGHRVLHSYSPDFNNPTLFGHRLNRADNDDRRTALNAMADAYVNAFLCARNASEDSHSLLHGVTQINLTPLSGNIYAGSFKDYSIVHLQPSYTICAILLAQAYLYQNNIDVMDTLLYYYTGSGNATYNAATGVLSGLVWN